MGFWKDKQDVVIGDGPADLLDGAVEKINEMYTKDIGRKATGEELVALMRFCSGGVCNGVVRMRKEDHVDTTTRRDNEEPVLQDDAGDQESEDTNTPAD